MPTCCSRKTSLEHWKWRPYKVRSLVSNSIYAKKDRNGQPTKSLLEMSPDTAMQFAFRCHPPTSLVLPFLLKQNLSPKDIAGSELMKLKDS